MMHARQSYSFNTQNAEFLILTYGAMVAQVCEQAQQCPRVCHAKPLQLVKDLEDPIEVNKQLEKM